MYFDDFFDSPLSITLQKVTSNNLLDLQIIGKETFFETFASSNSEADMKRYLEESFSLPRLASELNNPNSLFYFAKVENEVIGYLKLNFDTSQTERFHDQSMEIERIYVKKMYHGKNVGTKLLDKALKIANEKKIATVWLGVWENNERAIHFYKKHGFEVFSQHIFKLGNDEQIDLLMRLNVCEK
jgi:diamine N-acetyltransferase